jgi:putative transposase
MNITLTRKVRIDSSPKVQTILRKISRICVEVWNHCLVEQQNNPELTVYDQKRELPRLKKENPEFKQPSSQVLQNVVFSVHRSIKMAATKNMKGDGKARPPRLKRSERFYTQEYSQRNHSFKFEKNTHGKMFVKIAYGAKPEDWLPIEVESREDYDAVKTVTICYKDKKWYACLTFVSDLPPVKELSHTIYFDPGCLVSLTGIKTTGEFFEYTIRPLYAINRDTYKLIDELKAKRTKKKKGSYHYRRLTQQIRALFSKINTRSKTYLYTLCKQILDDHPDAHFKIGNWKKQDTLANTGNKNVDRKINRAVQNNNPLATLIKFFDYKARLRGQLVARFDERGTTRTCSACGFVASKGVNPSVRTFTCQRCSFTYPRDHQSCLNFIKKFESAWWPCLSGTLPDRSMRVDLHPFSFKPHRSLKTISAS